MQDKTPPNRRRRKPVGFATWTPKERTRVPLPAGLRRTDMAGLAPADAAQRLAELWERKKDTSPFTRLNRTSSLKLVLEDFQERGLDLATITPADVTMYRACLRDGIDAGQLNRNTISCRVKVWNAMLTALFGDNEEPGTGLRMVGWGQTAKAVRHLTEDEMQQIRQAAYAWSRWRSDYYRELYVTWWEISCCAGTRVGSLIRGNLKFGDIDYKDQVATLRHMKNMEELGQKGHEIILTDSATAQLAKFADVASRMAHWRGPDETVVFCRPSGESVTSHWLNRRTQDLCGLVGIDKHVTTHAVRKAFITLAAAKDREYARRQVGLSRRTMDRVYDQPLREDRMAKRDILPGAKWKPLRPEDVLWQAYRDLRSKVISQEQFDQIAERAERAKTAPSLTARSEVGYT